MLKRADITGIDLFAGAGGLSLGAHLAGVKITHAVENNPAAADTYRKNHIQTKVIEEDVSRIEPPVKKHGEYSMLFGGPPCQGFSTSNQRTRSAKNPKNWLFGEFFRFASNFRIFGGCLSRETTLPVQSIRTRTEPGVDPTS